MTKIIEKKTVKRGSQSLLENEELESMKINDGNINKPGQKNLHLHSFLL